MTRQKGKVVQIPDWYGAVGDGWNAILTMLHVKLMAVCPEYEAVQMKEKFGGLRAYLDFPERTSPGVRNAAYALEHEYEALSMSVCEVCGRLGTNQENSRHWWATRCETCQAERQP